MLACGAVVATMVDLKADLAEAGLTLLAAGARHMEVSLFIRNVLASKAFELDAANLGLVQVVFRRFLKRADDFWFEVGGGKRVSLRPIFDSPMRETDAYGNDYYRIGFNLT